jgi:hypothetical protein
VGIVVVAISIDWESSDPSGHFAVASTREG